MSDGTALLQALLALIFVLCLIGLTAIVARRFMPLLDRKLALPNRRLQVVESLPLDPQHRAVLLRCDGTEHLLVVGAGGTAVLNNAKPAADPTTPPLATPPLV